MPEMYRRGLILWNRGSMVVGNDNAASEDRKFEFLLKEILDAGPKIDPPDKVTPFQSGDRNERSEIKSRKPYLEMMIRIVAALVALAFVFRFAVHIAMK